MYAHASTFKRRGIEEIVEHAAEDKTNVTTKSCNALRPATAGREVANGKCCIVAVRRRLKAEKGAAIHAADEENEGSNGGGGGGGGGSVVGGGLDKHAADGSPRETQQTRRQTGEERSGCGGP